MNEYQEKKLNSLPQHKQDFINKQLQVFDSWMKGKMFMSFNGKCYHCGVDIIEHEIKKGNDGSKGVTGCPSCHRSYCD